MSFVSVIVICVQCFEPSANSRGSRQILFSLFLLLQLFSESSGGHRGALRGGRAPPRGGVVPCIQSHPQLAPQDRGNSASGLLRHGHTHLVVSLLLSRRLRELVRKSCPWRPLASAVAFLGTLTGLWARSALLLHLASSATWLCLSSYCSCCTVTAPVWTGGWTRSWWY